MSANEHGMTVPDTFAGQHILLTGATGRVGARFIPLLTKAGARLRLMVWGPPPPTPPKPGAAMVMGDLCDEATCAGVVEGVDAVVHIASAFQGVTGTEAYDLNYRATAALTTAALKAGVVRFVQMSSYLVYQPDLSRPAVESDPLRPVGAGTFPAAKLGAEQACTEAADAGLPVTVLRVAYTYGEGDPHLADAFAWARMVADDRRLHLVHHADVRQGVRLSLASVAPGHRVYNLADDGPVSTARLRGYAADFPVPGDAREWADLAEDDTFRGEIDTSAARAELGFVPGFRSIEDAARAGQL